MSANNKKQFCIKDNCDREDCFCFWLGSNQNLSSKVGLVASQRNLGHAMSTGFIYIGIYNRLMCQQNNLFHFLTYSLQPYKSWSFLRKEYFEDFSKILID